MSTLPYVSSAGDGIASKSSSYWDLTIACISAHFSAGSVTPSRVHAATLSCVRLVEPVRRPCLDVGAGVLLPEQVREDARARALS